MVENPADITGKPEENTVGFRSELSPGADWVYVKVISGKSAYSEVTRPIIPPNAEYRLYEYVDCTPMIGQKGLGGSGGVVLYSVD